MSSIVRRSASRICSVLSTRMGGSSVLLVLDCGQSALSSQLSDLAGAAGHKNLIAESWELIACFGGRVKGAVYVNGTITPADQAVIPVYDHGFMYGEGVYETLRTYNRVPFLYDRHMRRLRASAGALQLDVPFDDDTLRAWIDDTVAAAARLPERLRSLHPHPADARRRRADLRRQGHAGAVARHHRQAVRRAAGPNVRRRDRDLAGVRSCATIPDRSTRSSSRTTCSTTRSPCRRRIATAAKKR